MGLTPEEIQAQERAIVLNRNIRGTTPTPPAGTPQSTLDVVLQDENLTWKYSESGGGGALLGIPNAPGVTGVAIKTEHPVMVKKAQKVSQLMDGFLQNSEGSPPFSSPRALVYTKQDLIDNNGIAQGLLERMNGVDLTRFQGGMNEDVLNDVKAFYTNPGHENTTDNSVLVMEFAKGTQINKLPEPEKVALLKSEAFAQTIGRALAPSTVLGLTDHLRNDRANVSNFMYDPDSGTLSVIDYDTHFEEHPSRDLDLIKFGPPLVVQQMEQLRTYLEECTQDQEAFDRAVEDLVNPNGRSPLKEVMTAFWEPGSDSFFDRSQKGAFDDLSEEDRRQFAMNLMKGAIDGMEYVQKNMPALRTSVENTREIVKGEQLDHFYTEQQLQELENEMAKLQPDDLREKLAQLSTGNTHAFNEAYEAKLNDELNSYLAGLDEKETPLNNRLQEVQDKIDRIKNHPTAGDRLKQAFTPKGHRPIDKLRNEEQNLREQLQIIQGLRNDAPRVIVAEPLQDLHERQDFQTRMNTVESQVKPPTVQTVPKQIDEIEIDEINKTNVSTDNLELEEIVSKIVDGEKIENGNLETNKVGNEEEAPEVRGLERQKSVRDMMREKQVVQRAKEQLGLDKEEEISMRNTKPKVGKV